MQEIIAQVISQARGAWRFRWYALLVAWIVAIAGWVVVFSMPNQYQAYAQVYADTDSMLTPLLSGLAIRPDVHQRVRLVTKTLLSRPNLEKVVRETGLGLRAPTPTATDKLLKNLSHKVEVHGGGSENLYSIQYTDRDPKVAQGVVQALLNILMTKTLNGPMQSMGMAQNFLNHQVKEYKDRLESAEKKLTKFRQAHLGLVPSQGGETYFGRLHGARQTLTQLKANLEVAQSKRDTIAAQLRSVKAGRASSAANPRIKAINDQIAKYHEQLNNLLLVYTPKYPDVIATKSMIAQLKEKRAEIKKGGASAVAATTIANNPVVQNLQTGLYSARVDVNTLKSKIQRQKKQVAGLEGKADKVTELQAKLTSLTRDYSVTQTQYKTLLQRLDKAKMSQQASHRGNNLKFRIVEAPIVPLVSSGPPRLIYLAVVFIFALGIGAAFAVFLHQLRPVFMDKETLRDVIGRPVLGTVSIALSGAVTHPWRKEVTRYSAGLLLLVIVFGCALALQGQLTHWIQSVLPGAGGLV